MNKSLLVVTALLLLGAVKMAAAAGGYNNVPPNDSQFRGCISYANKNYEGGNAPSPVAGQTKVVAYCECMWNETPDSFRGNLVKFAESDKGKKVNRICEKHSGWVDY